MNNITTDELQRVSKPSARKLYNSGVEIYIIPHKVRPCTACGIGAFYSKDLYVDFDGDFDALVNQYTYYNCQYNEWGKYPAFYVRKEDLA